MKFLEVQMEYKLRKLLVNKKMRRTQYIKSIL